MLGSLRKSTHSWAARGLLVLLAASFGLWGIGDIFRGGREPAVASVGEIDVPASVFGAEFRNEVNRLQGQGGAAFTTDEAIAAGLHYTVLGRLVRDALLEQEALRLGLAVPDDDINRAVTTNPAFQNDQGRFDAETYRRILSRNGFSPEQYEALLRQEKTIQAIQDTIVAPLPAPSSWVDTLYLYREESRIAEFVLIGADRRPAEHEPDEAEIEAFHQENAVFYTAPEYRELTYLELTPAALLDEIELSLDDLFYEYEARLDEYAQPERRRVEQILAPDRETADAILRELQSGKTFADAADAYREQGASHLELGLVARSEVFEEIAPTIFGLSAGGVSRPLETGLGWHFFWVRDIQPPETKSFDEVVDELRADLAQVMARDGLYQLANRLEDALAGGATLEETADLLALSTTHIPVITRSGVDDLGMPVTILPSMEQFLDVAFSTETGYKSHLLEDPDGNYLIIRVDSGSPPALRPLDEVRDVVIEHWKAFEQLEGAEQIAMESVERLGRGESLAAIAAEFGISVRTSDPLGRVPGEGGDPTLNGVLNGVFALDPNQPGGVSGPSMGGYVVAQLKEVVPADPTGDKAATRSLARELESGIADDLLMQYQAALEARYPISINVETVDSLF